jgi:phosphoribosylamine--glycine ligase
MDAATGRLDEAERLRWRPESAVAVVVAAQDYPDSPRKGDPIGGLDRAEELEGVHVVHAGTALAREGEHAGRIVSAGGRVLAVVALGADLDEARDRAYRGTDLIELEGSQHRTDIALKAARGQITVPSHSAPRPRQEQA